MKSLVGNVNIIVLAVMVTQLVACSSLSTPNDTMSVTPARASAQPSGTKVDFSKPLTAAMSQMSNEEAAQMSAELESLNRGRESGAISEADYWVRVRELEALATKHSADALSQIEAGQ